MDEKDLRSWFNEEQVPTWTCPTCHVGILKRQGKFLVHADHKTAQYGGEDWFEPVESGYVFVGHLKCSNCSENVIVSGVGGIEEDYDECNNREYVTVLSPRFFCPALRIINPNVNESVPKNVKTNLEKSFETFWCDSDACVNRLRTVAEFLLDDFGVARTNEKGARLPFDARIGKMTDPRLLANKDLIMSLRHMGNDASHGSIGINRQELINAFSVVKHCLEQLYPKQVDHSKILQFVEKVNANKGFREKKPK